MLIYYYLDVFLICLSQIGDLKILIMLFFNNNVVFVNADSNNVTFFSDGMSLITLNVSLDNNNFDYDDLESLLKSITKCT